MLIEVARKDSLAVGIFAQRRFGCLQRVPDQRNFAFRGRILQPSRLVRPVLEVRKIALDVDISIRRSVICAMRQPVPLEASRSTEARLRMSTGGRHDISADLAEQRLRDRQMLLRGISSGLQQVQAAEGVLQFGIGFLDECV